MDGFSFPPPPPPPPKAASSSSSQPETPNQFSNRGGRGGRGGRGNHGSSRGRGGAPQRGGGNFQHQNTNSTGYGQNTGNPGYGNQQQQYRNPSQYQSNQYYQALQQYQPPQQYQAPPGSYINPAFGGMQAQAYSHPQMPQYGQQTVYEHSNQPSYGTPNHASSPPGGKRTRDQAFGSSNRGHPMKKPSSAPKAQVAPAVPSFGAPILPQKPQAPLSSGGGLKQRPSTGLGLIPQTYGTPENSDHEEDEDEEEVDEEAALSALQDGPQSFEFNGELSTLGSAADIDEWIEERKKRWPSKRRVEEKEIEVQSRMEERRRIEQETRAAIASASGGEYQPVERRDDRQQRQMRKPATERQARQNEGSTVEGTHKELELQVQKVDELQTLLAEKGQDQGQTATERAEQAIDETEQAEQAAAATEDMNADQALKTPGQDIAADDQHLSDSDSDAPPKKPLRNSHIQFAYKHDASSGQEKGKRKTLYQRLVEQEMDEENKLALQAIKYLGGVGFFSKHAAST
ncbi:unnamed protein product [Aureobasidium uvarum]|uniref:FMR1-interacting protein 1 conserved domain-containing protein n=1 Tax=Aureobasidium uvarum TaxID=2773716 RepID=A0A9N8PMN8_9PEZI|nr:unnamed protein product [Aureobasidium uvarum]